MNDMLDTLPSFRQMFKLIVFLILALIVLGLVAAIIKAVMPLLIVAAIVVGGVYLYNKLQAEGAR